VPIAETVIGILASASPLTLTGGTRDTARSSFLSSQLVFDFGFSAGFENLFSDLSCGFFCLLLDFFDPFFPLFPLDGCG